MNYLQKYKPFLGFLARFFGSYALLSLLYQGWLSMRDATVPDPITELVARQSAALLRAVGHFSEAHDAPGNPFVRFWFEDRYVSRIVEGCNGVSVMILFVSFVIAFAGRWRTTALFCVAGIVVIHVLNVARISLLAYLLYYYPEYRQVSHDTIFPLIIYGTVFALWVIWVTRFSSLANVKR